MYKQPGHHITAGTAHAHRRANTQVRACSSVGRVGHSQTVAMLASHTRSARREFTVPVCVRLEYGSCGEAALRCTDRATRKHEYAHIERRPMRAVRTLFESVPYLAPGSECREMNEPCIKRETRNRVHGASAARIWCSRAVVVAAGDPRTVETKEFANLAFRFEVWKLKGSPKPEGQRGDERVEGGEDARRAGRCYEKAKINFNSIGRGYRPIPEIDSLEYRDLLHIDNAIKISITLSWALRSV
ncbi:hypothetical protein DFH09DRAFT_1104135 [Mycena vulgaris]|nr:hypothetical protein DFH09DRAFT_1104135 [Mycena vulgaris]